MILTDLVAKMPDATLDELREQMKKLTRVEVSITTLWRILDALGLSRKKSPAGQQKPIRKNKPGLKRRNKS
jgi:transposase